MFVLRTPILTLCLALAGGCSSEPDDLRVYVDDLKSKPKKQAPQVLPLKAYPRFGYVSETLRDPFTSDVSGSKTTSSGKTLVDPHQGRVKQPLEKFPLDALTLVGVLRRSGVVLALIRTPEGKIRRVAQGDYLGLNNGRVLRVEPTGLTLLETFPNGKAERRLKRTELRLSGVRRSES